MKSIEATGKKLDDAIKAGLDELGVTIDDVDVEVLCSGGWLKKAKVRLTVNEEELEAVKILNEALKPETKTVPEESKTAAYEKKKTTPERFERDEKKKENRKASENYFDKKPEWKPVEQKPVEQKNVDLPAETRSAEESKEQPAREVNPQQVELAKAYLTSLLEKMGVEAELVITTDKGSIDVDIVTEDSTVIGHHGEVLDSMQQLCKRAVEEGEDKHLPVNLDCKGYREHREKVLVSIANKMAAKALRTGRKVVLEPMNNTQRKIIHATLNENDRVFTRSEGKEPNRRVVIIPKRSNRGRRYGEDRSNVANQE